MLSEEAREARNRYAREWKKKNPDKVKAAANRYWERKAMAETEPVESRILRMHDQGLSLRMIASIVDMNHVRVSRIIAKHTG